MKKIVKQIENYIQLHTSDIETEDYVDALREIAEWATSQADTIEYGLNLSDSFDEA